MSGTTPNYGWPYQNLTDAPNGAALGQSGFDAADASLAAEAAARVALAATQDASGRGRMGSVAYTTVNAIVTSEVQIGTFTFTAVAGRRYRAIITGSTKMTTTGDVAEFIVRYKAGATVGLTDTELFIHEMPNNPGLFGFTQTAIWEFTSPGSGQYTFGFSTLHAAGGGSMNIVPDAHQPCQLAIDDIGT